MIIFRFLIGIVLITIPGALYYYKGFEVGVISALILLIFLVCACLEELTVAREERMKKNS